jgi:hypothetical protein
MDSGSVLISILVSTVPYPFGLTTRLPRYLNQKGLLQPRQIDHRLPLASITEDHLLAYINQAEIPSQGVQAMIYTLREPQYLLPDPAHKYLSRIALLNR